WVGHTSIQFDRHPNGANLAPVRVTPDAFSPGVAPREPPASPHPPPARGRALIPVHRLVNGASTRREPARGCVTYFHVELDRHDVLLAEGLPAESYLDTGNRATFTEGGAALAMHPDFAREVWQR